MKKRPFLLLEIVIAIFLVALIAVPLLKKPIALYRSEIAALKELEGERLADQTFAEIQEQLFNNRIPWKNLPQKGEEKSFILPPLSSIGRKVRIKCQKEKEEGGKSISRLLIVEVEFTPPLTKRKSPYTYHTIVQKKNEK